MANVWKDPIFDRTLDDVEFALRKIRDWKKNHTHSVDVTIEDDMLVVQDKSVTYVTNDILVRDGEGAVVVEDGFLHLNIDDVYDLKGCLNLTDLNRIEGNIEYLAEKMENYYYAPNIRCKVWTTADMPNQNDTSRIVSNIRSLIDSFYTPTNPPSLPNTMVRYDEINAIEENLYLLKQMLDCMQTSFKKSATVKCGAKTLLPIRR